MIPSVILWLVGRGVPARFAKPLLIAVGGLLIILAVFAAVKIHDHRLIKQHTAEQEAATAKADRAADAVAADQRRTDDQRQNAEQSNLKETVDEAHRTGADPRSAYYHCLGLLQDARRRGVSPPKC